MRNTLIILIAVLITCSAFLAGKKSPDSEQEILLKKKFIPSASKTKQLNFFDAKKYLDEYEKNKKLRNNKKRRALNTYAKF